MWRRWTSLRRMTLFLVLLVAWQLTAVALGTPELPTVPHFIDAAVETVPTGVFWVSVADTAVGWAAGLAIASTLGIVIGTIIGLSVALERATRIPIAVLYAVPSITLVPLLLLVLGSTMMTKILLVTIAAVWPVILHAETGVREVDAVARETARSYRLARRDVVLMLYLPSAVPITATGVRIAATIALQISVACELVAGVPGLGHQILILSVNSPDPAVALVYFVAAAALGFCISLMFRRIERAAMFWHPSRRAERGQSR
jgi:ABC-type nitrate/sulfonate/bicarbonate transport system permease component